jgi:hypothetical protein
VSADHVQEWLTAARRELGLEDAAEGEQGLGAAEALAALVHEKVGPAAAPSTVFLVGVAAGRAADPAVAARDFTEKLSTLARSWNADSERSATPNKSGTACLPRVISVVGVLLSCSSISALAGVRFCG